MISKKIKETVTVDRTIYIAEDGTEFEEYRACELHEKNLRKIKMLDALQLIERKESLDDRTPLDGGEYYESHDYRWYRPKNIEEINILNELFNIEDRYVLTDIDIGEWVCIENFDISRCDYNDTYVYPLKDSIHHIKWFLKQFGYEISIEEREEKC